MTNEAKRSLRAVVNAQVKLWDAQRDYEREIGSEVINFDAVTEYAICAEDVGDSDLETLASQLEMEGPVAT